MKLKAAINPFVLSLIFLARTLITAHGASPGVPSNATPEKSSGSFISASSNAAPVMQPISDQAVEEGAFLQLTAQATDSDARQTIRYSLGPNVPAGASVNVTNGLFTWMPSPTQARSTNQVTLIATDNGSPSRSTSQTFTIVVRQRNPLTLASAGGPASVSPSGTLNQAGTKDISETTVSGTALSGQTVPSPWILERSTNAVDWVQVDDGMLTTETNIIYRVRPAAP